MNDSSSAVRLSAHSCVGHICEDVWAVFGLKQKEVVFDHVIRAVKEDLVNVRLTALQALSSMFTSVAFVDARFVDVVVDVCVSCLSEDHVLVRQKAATTVANMCHVQVTKQATFKSFPLLANVLISHDNDEDKVMAPLVRAMGFLCVLEEDCRLRESLLEVIVRNVTRGNAKLRWTACNSLECIASSTTGYRFLDSALASKLVAVLMKEENFKVKASALAVLRCNVKSYATDALAITTAQDLERCYHALEERLNASGLREYEALKDFRQRLLVALCFFLTNQDNVRVSQPDSVQRDIIRALRFKAPKGIPLEESVLEQALNKLRGIDPEK